MLDSRGIASRGSVWTRAYRWRQLSTIAALALLAGCKGDTGPQGPPGPPGSGGDGGTNGTVIHVPPNSQAPTDASSAAWAALQPQVTVQSVTISSPPVVTFTVKDAAGNPIAGLGSTSQSATATLPGYTNLAFGMAKLVPGDASDAHNVPSKWVSYIVTTVPTTTTAAAPSRPSTDNAGTLRRQRRRDVRLHVLPRRRADQGPGRGDDGVSPQ